MFQCCWCGLELHFTLTLLSAIFFLSWPKSVKYLFLNINLKPQLQQISQHLHYKGGVCWSLLKGPGSGLADWAACCLCLTTPNTMDGEVLHEFMSQSGSRCLLCLASGWVISHTNDHTDNTEVGWSNPLSCVTQEPCVCYSLFWHLQLLQIPQKKKNWIKNIKCLL